MPASKADALEALRPVTPPRLYAFAEHLAADPEMDAQRAAEAVGAPGDAAALLKDARTLRVLQAIMAADSEALTDQRRNAILILAQLVCYDPRDLFNADGFMLRIHEMPASIRAAISGFELNEDGTVKKIRFINRLDALKLLLQHFGDLPQDRADDKPLAAVVFRGRGET